METDCLFFVNFILTAIIHNFPIASCMRLAHHSNVEGHLKRQFCVFSDNPRKMESQNLKGYGNLEDVINQDFEEDSGFIDVSWTKVNSFLFFFSFA